MFKNHANNIKIQQYYYFLKEEKNASSNPVRL